MARGRRSGRGGRGGRQGGGQQGGQGGHGGGQQQGGQGQRERDPAGSHIVPTKKTSAFKKVEEWLLIVFVILVAIPVFYFIGKVGCAVMHADWSLGGGARNTTATTELGWREETVQRRQLELQASTRSKVFDPWTVELLPGQEIELRYPFSMKPIGRRHPCSGPELSVGYYYYWLSPSPPSAGKAFVPVVHDDDFEGMDHRHLLETGAVRGRRGEYYFKILAQNKPGRQNKGVLFIRLPDRCPKDAGVLWTKADHARLAVKTP